MNPIIIPKKKIHDIGYYYKEIKRLKKFFYYKIDNRDIDNILSDINKHNDDNDSYFVRLNFLYFLCELLASNNIYEPISTGKPRSGYEFINKDTLEGYSIFHLHLSGLDKSILIWYLEMTDNGLFVRFKYLNQHPSDDYENILNDIFNNKNSFHLEKYDFLNNLKKLLHFKERKLYNFNDYKQINEKNMIRKFINYFKKDNKEETSEPIIKKDFNIDEFNDWFNNEYDGYDGRKGNKGIFLRLDKLSPYMIEDYLIYIGQETTDKNISKYNLEVREDWFKKLQ